MAGHYFFDLVVADQRHRAERLVAAGAEFQSMAEMTLVAADGTPIAVRASVAPMAFDERPAIALVIMGLDDIAALKASEAAVRESGKSLGKSRAQHEIFIQRAPLSIAMFDREMNYLAASDRWLEEYGRGYADLVGLNHYRVHPDVPDEWRRVHAQALAGATVKNDEDLWITADGARYWLRWAVVPWTEGNGEIGGLIISAENITERKRAEESLKAAKAEAERAVLARSKFLAAASHDLRQPVQSLVLLMAVLKGQATAPAVTKAVDMMENALDGLNTLLTSILDVSRLDAGVVMPRMESVDVGALIGRLALEYTLLAADKGLRVKAVRPGVWARTDSALLERAVRNLIENAIRYTNTGGLLLGVRRQGGRARVEVVDTGIGIAADKLPYIFDEFYQVGNPGRDRGQGLGLGLSIVGRLAQVLGAELLVSSVEGRGTRFSLLLALDQASGRSARAIPTETKAEGRLLIIEDDGAVRMGLQLLVESWGYEARAVESGERALALQAEGEAAFDAIIVDHRLGPGPSGTAVAKEINARHGRAIPTLVVTGDTAPERIAEVHASGFEMLHKPVAPEVLRQKLARLLITSHAVMSETI